MKYQMYLVLNDNDVRKFLFVRDHGQVAHICNFENKIESYNPKDFIENSMDEAVYLHIEEIVFNKKIIEAAYCAKCRSLYMKKTMREVREC